jgi:hypothetical protein
MRDSQFREELGKNRQKDESRAFVGSKVVDVAEEMTGALFFISISIGPIQKPTMNRAVCEPGSVIKTLYLHPLTNHR